MNRKKILQSRNKIFNFILATSMVIGIVIGTGIFFKNSSIIAWSNGNAIIVLLAWIFGAIIAMAVTLSYAQIARHAPKSNTGIGEFAQVCVGEKFGRHTKIVWPYFYFSFFFFALCCYTSSFVINLYYTSKGADVDKIDTTLPTILVAFAIAAFFLTINIFWQKFAEWLQINMTFIKALPIVLLAVGGFATFFYLSNNNWWSHAQENMNGNSVPSWVKEKSSETKNFNFGTLVIFLLPATLFSFDGSISVTNLTEDVSRKTITYALIGGMTIVSILYILVTIAILNTGTLNAEDALVKMFGGDPASKGTKIKIFSAIIQALILIVGLSTTNGLSIAWIRGTKAIIKSPTTKRIISHCLLGFSFYAIPLAALTLVLNYSGIYKTPIGINLIDAISNVVIIITYAIYGVTLIFATFKNKKEVDPNKKYSKWFIISALIAIIGIVIVVGYEFFYVFLYQVILHPTQIVGGVYAWLYMLISIFYIAWWFVMPLILIQIFKNKITEKK